MNDRIKALQQHLMNDDLTVTSVGQDTLIVYGETTVVLQGVVLNADQVWARTEH